MKEAFYNCEVCCFEWTVTWSGDKSKDDMRDTCPYCLDYSKYNVSTPYYESEVRKDEQAN